MIKKVNFFLCYIHRTQEVVLEGPLNKTRKPEGAICKKGKTFIWVVVGWLRVVPWPPLLPLVLSSNIRQCFKPGPVADLFFGVAWLVQLKGQRTWYALLAETVMLGYLLISIGLG